MHILRGNIIHCREFPVYGQPTINRISSSHVVSITHLARLPAFSNLGLVANGGRNAINANHATHGPSWRMIVSLTPTTEAYGIYPGGQSGNPGSKYYNDFVKDWADENYYTLWVMKAEESKDKRIIQRMSFGR